MRLRQIVLGVMSACAFDDELFGGELENVARVGRHDVLVVRVD